MSKVDTFLHIIEDVKEPKASWTNKQLTQFHYFNPNGARAKAAAMSETISQHVEMKMVSSGWILAYGTFHDFYERELSELQKKKRVRAFDIEWVVRGLNEKTNNGYTKLGEQYLPYQEYR